MGFSEKENAQADLEKKYSRRNLLRSLSGSAVVASLPGCSVIEHLLGEKEKPHLAGQRIDVLSFGAGLHPLSGPKAEVILPAPQNIKAWPQQNISPEHLSTNAAGRGVHPLWSMSIGAGDSTYNILKTALSIVTTFPNSRGAIASPPVVAGGRIFTSDAQGNVRAWTWPKRHFLWSFQPAINTNSSNIGGGIAVDGDILYVVDGVTKVWALYAATGKIKWSSEAGTPGRSAPVVAKGLLAFTTIDERLFVLDTETGKLLWTYRGSPAATVIFGASTPAISGDTLIAGFNSGDLVALRVGSGEIIWSDSLGGGNGRGAALDFACIRGCPVIVGNTVYAASMSQVLVAMDVRSGRRLWEREASSQNPLCVCGNWLYVLSLDQQLACLDRFNGRVQWVTQLRRFSNEKHQKGAIEWVGPLMVDGRLICFSTLAHAGLAVIHADTGRVEKIRRMPGGSSVQPIICDGQILVITHNGDLHSYG
ncbi:dehydrogenase [Acetobacteraceae bacterium]|nr:dehydrogenase [Acetobacteraceae bacterium]